MVINTKFSSLLSTYNVLCCHEKASANRISHKCTKFKVKFKSCLLSELSYFRSIFLQWLAQLKSGHVELHQQHPHGVLDIDEASPLLPPTAGHLAEEEEARTREKR